jgi:hemoglobin
VSETPGLYTWAGGDAAFERLIGAFYDRVERDELISPLMSLAADDAELPSDPEFRSAFVGYVEWGTRIALANAAPGAEVVQHAPVPHWGWGVAPPYTPGG